MSSRRPPSADDAVRYDISVDAYVRRIDATSLINPVCNKNKRNEFIWVIEDITETQFNESEWTGREIESDISMCICSQAVCHTYSIHHLPTGHNFLVGSQCVQKISPTLATIITHDKCKKCSEPVLDKRTKCGKLGFCSEECMWKVELLSVQDRLKRKYRVPFGKHKGKKIEELPKSYLTWMNKTLGEMEVKNDSKDSWMIRTMRYILGVAV